MIETNCFSSIYQYNSMHVHFYTKCTLYIELCSKTNKIYQKIEKSIPLPLMEHIQYRPQYTYMYIVFLFLNNIATS